MTLFRRLFTFAAVVLLFSGAQTLSAVESKSLLATDGTLYVVRAGTGAEFGMAGNYALPTDVVLQWSSLRQDGATAGGLIPGVAGTGLKHNLDLAYDEPSGSLIVLWTEEAPLLNLLHLGIFHANQWQVSDLLPNLGFPRALNARMILSHPVVHSLDADGNDVSTTRSILSVIWFEVSNVSQARYAPIFLDEDSSVNDVQVYDLPATIGGGGPTSSSTDIPAGAYLYPALQLEGPGGGLVANFADLNARKNFVVRITFPTDLGKPGPANPTWLRRRVPIVGVVNEGPIARMAPGDGSFAISTFIGSSYRPTLSWRTTTSVQYSRFDGKAWSEINSIELSDSMTYEKAIHLVQDMATLN